MKSPLLWFLVLEAGYLIVARGFIWWNRQHAWLNTLNEELVWSVWRLLSALSLWWLYRKLEPMPETPVSRVSGRGYWVLLPLCLGFLCVPALSPGYNIASPLNWVFAATSLAVGIREEIAYRGILQTALHRHLGLLPALLISNVAFIFYHAGAIPLTLLNCIEFFFAGLFLGIVYWVTRRLWLPIALHTVYDALYAMGPFLETPRDKAFTMTVLVVCVLLTAGILLVIRYRKAPSTHP